MTVYILINIYLIDKILITLRLPALNVKKLFNFKNLSLIDV